VDSAQSGIANLHCKNHSAILLCWRSAEVCALWVLIVIISVETLVFNQQASRWTLLGFVSFRAMQHERDMSYYIWLETSHDILATETSSKSSTDFASTSTLIMKARGYTPAVQRCASVSTLEVGQKQKFYFRRKPKVGWKWRNTFGQNRTCHRK